MIRINGRAPLCPVNRKGKDMKEIRIGLAGLGFMGSTHYRIYSELPGCRVVAVADVDAAKRTGDISRVVGNIGNYDNSVPFDFSKVKTYETAEAMIAAGGIDMIDICVPTPYHKEIILAALGAGLHVFSEKPLCRNLEQMREIEAAVKKSGKFFNVGMCIRAWPEYHHAATMFKAGKFGKLYSADFRRLSPTVDGNAWQNWFANGDLAGGALLDLHLHDCDAVRYFFGRPKAVTTFGVKNVWNKQGAYDQVVTDYDFGDGSLVTAQGGWCANKSVPFEMSFQLICEKATVRMMSEGYKIYWNDGRVETPEVADAKLPTGWHQELNYFVNCVRDGVMPDKYQKLGEVVDSFRMIMAEEESANAKKTVTIQY